MRSYEFLIEEEYFDKNGDERKARKRILENSNHLKGAIRKLYQDMPHQFRIIMILDPYKQ